MDDLDAQLVRDALEILDRYRAPLAKRDHVKSLDDRAELLGRVRAALEPLTWKGGERRARAALGFVHLGSSSVVTTAGYADGAGQSVSERSNFRPILDTRAAGQSVAQRLVEDSRKREFIAPGNHLVEGSTCRRFRVWRDTGPRVGRFGPVGDDVGS